MEASLRDHFATAQRVHPRSGNCFVTACQLQLGTFTVPDSSESRGVDGSSEPIGKGAEGRTRKSFNQVGAKSNRIRQDPGTDCTRKAAKSNRIRQDPGTDCTRKA
eukprot:1763252-Rhodomonas_salina.1